MFEIEKGIPIPTTRGGKKKELRLVMEKMEVGDSVLVSNTHRQQVHQIAKAIGIKYASRTVCKESGQIRVWRTK